MAIPVRINQWVQSRVQWQVLGQRAEFTLSWKAATTTVWTTAELIALNTNLQATIRPYLEPVTNNGVLFTRIITTDLTPLGTTQAEHNVTYPGTASGDVEPLNVTMCISWRTGQVGRSKRGRMYAPPTSEVNFSAGVATAAYMAALSGLASQISNFTNAGGRSVVHAVASRKNLALYPVTGIVIDNIPDSQRRRLQGRGR